MKRMSGEKDQSRAAGGPALEVRALELGSTVKPGGNGETLEVRRCKRNEEPPVCRCSGGGVERLAVDGGGREMVRVLGQACKALALAELLVWPCSDLSGLSPASPRR